MSRSSKQRFRRRQRKEAAGIQTSPKDLARDLEAMLNAYTEGLEQK